MFTTNQMGISVVLIPPPPPRLLKASSCTKRLAPNLRSHILYKNARKVLSNRKKYIRPTQHIVISLFILMLFTKLQTVS